MKSRIPKIALCLALAVPTGCGTVQVMKAGCVDTAMEAVLFYGNLSARMSEAVTKFRRLPERMNPTCSECN